jgi:glyoxalase/bleomycin resistance protein/dioxygenase superfamily protein
MHGLQGGRLEAVGLRPPADRVNVWAVLTPNEFFHFALIVPQLEPALDELTKLLGYDFGPIYEGGLALHQPDVGPRELTMKIAMSAQAPHLEVIEARPGTPWALSENGSNLHHIAYWTDDLDGAHHDVASICPVEIMGVARDGRKPATFTYHERGGLRVELVHRGRTSDAQR